MRIAITGADGFVGRHATRVFRERGYDVLELVGGAAADGAKQIDLREARSIRRALENSEVTHLLHLGGASSVARSHENPGEAFAINALGTVHLLDAIRRTVPSARVVVVSSGEVYGNLGHQAREEDPTMPTSPYAASKLAAEIAAKQFHTSYGIPIVIARPFNHLGSGQAPHFVMPSFARQLVEIKSHGGGELHVGNLESVRDFSHVLDVVDAYEILLDRGVAGEIYNIASGVGRSIRSLLDKMIELERIKVVPTVDSARLRATDLPALVGDPSRAASLGWRPRRTIEECLTDVLYEARGN